MWLLEASKSGLLLHFVTGTNGFDLWLTNSWEAFKTCRDVVIGRIKMVKTNVKSIRIFSERTINVDQFDVTWFAFDVFTLDLLADRLKCFSVCRADKK